MERREAGAGTGDFASGNPERDAIPTYLEAFMTEDQINTKTETFLWKMDLSRALSQLTPQQHRTLTLRYGLGGCMPQNVDTTAKLMGISTEMVRRNINNAFEKLRKCPVTEEILNNPPKADMSPTGFGRVGKVFKY